MKILLTILTVALIIQFTTCMQGIDSHNLLQTSTYQCIKSKGNLFAIVRGTTNAGQVDSNAQQNLLNAASAGMLTDVLLVPCRGKNSITQAQQLLSKIPQNLYNTIWIQVMPNESSQICSWQNTDPVSNCVFLNEIVDVLTKNKIKHIGIFTSLQAWKNIFKSQGGCSQLAKRQLWYSNNNGVDSFDDFKPFNGWTVPRMKQYDIGYVVCGAKTPANYHPSA